MNNFSVQLLNNIASYCTQVQNLHHRKQLVPKSTFITFSGAKKIFGNEKLVNCKCLKIEFSANLINIV